MKFSAIIVLAFAVSCVSALPQPIRRAAVAGAQLQNRQDAPPSPGNNAGNGKAAGNNGNNSTSGDPQTSLTLDPKVIASGFKNNGQSNPEPGQVASLTSSNNFINFCLTTKLPLTNGQQIKGGSCNPAPMGIIPSINNMPSSKFQFPLNNAEIAPNTAFTVKLAMQHLETGNFVNADENYFAAPQQINGGGDIKGHSHIVIEKLDSLTQSSPTNPQKFAFFKGMNTAGTVLTADVTGGLGEGVYRIASINTAANHQPVLVPIAQHGSLDDMVYFTVKQGAKS